MLIVDDSAFARKVLREILSAHAGIEVVAIARDGLEALELISQHHPDVVTLDLLMPNLDGLGVLRSLPHRRPPCVVVTVTESDSELGIEALESGAIDLVHKPTALATSRLYELSKELVEKVLAAANARPRTPIAEAPVIPVVPLPRATTSKSVLVIGTSTGGPAALRTLLPALPGNYPLPIVVALHIPPGYTEALARRLDQQCEISVEEAVDGRALRPGVAMICPGGQHVSLARNAKGEAIVRLSDQPTEAAHAPSVDALFASAAEVFGARALGVVLTGMGRDGLEGARKIAGSGGSVLCEAESSAVIYGMPRVVFEAKLAEAEAPLDAMAALVVEHTG